MTQPIVHVDAFTDAPFGGNPAAVCVLPAGRDAGWMQHVAREMNLSETAFLAPRQERDEGYELRLRGVMITSRADEPGVDFVSRYFAPAFGIDEDPVTGSTPCCLGPFWSRRLNTRTFVARQVSERGGMLKVALDGERVRLGGQAVTVLRGELLA
jgi:predicted PhzF superfamily epimerase YddE/YHI9